MVSVTSCLEDRCPKYIKKCCSYRIIWFALLLPIYITFLIATIIASTIKEDDEDVPEMKKKGFAEYFFGIIYILFLSIFLISILKYICVKCDQRRTHGHQNTIYGNSRNFVTLHKQYNSGQHAHHHQKLYDFSQPNQIEATLTDGPIHQLLNFEDGQTNQNYEYYVKYRKSELSKHQESENSFNYQEPEIYSNNQETEIYSNFQESDNYSNHQNSENYSNHQDSENYSNYQDSENYSNQESDIYSTISLVYQSSQFSTPPSTIAYHNERSDTSSLDFNESMRENFVNFEDNFILDQSRQITAWV